MNNNQLYKNIWASNDEAPACPMRKLSGIGFFQITTFSISSSETFRLWMFFSSFCFQGGRRSGMKGFRGFWVNHVHRFLPFFAWDSLPVILRELCSAITGFWSGASQLDTWYSHIQGKLSVLWALLQTLLFFLMFLLLSCIALGFSSLIFFPFSLFLKINVFM